MKAGYITEHGGPEVIRIGELPSPKITNDLDVLVEVNACGLNHGLDGRLRRDGAGRKLKFPHIPGVEVVGRVVALGARVPALNIGDNVVVAPWITCGVCRACLQGKDNSCSTLRMVGVDVAGGCGELVCIPHSMVLPIPKELAAYPSKVACLPISYVTAYHMLKRAVISQDDVVLVLGAAGSVGLAAVQLALSIGARVIATASGHAKVAFLKEQGVSDVINLSTHSLTTEVLRTTEGRGVDILVNHVGAAIWEESLNTLNRDARVAVCGATTGEALMVNARHLWRKNISLNFSNSGTREDLLRVLNLTADRSIHPVIAAEYRLEDLPLAHARLEDRNLVGKLVLRHPKHLTSTYQKELT